MDQHTAFRLLAEETIPELRGRACLYQHRATGAQVLSVVNDDPNKVFGITFRTLPGDSTGVAHILEHAVLSGSRRYPLRKPFVELLKGSMQTYLNAMTWPDMTCYPVASQNVQDFHNLVDVYLDAVFFPRLTEDTFRQEAWHYAPRGDALELQGVVYNEMKGFFSSPRGVLDEATRRALFPDTVYGLGYGGDPDAIPDLTLPLMRAFHRRFYTPANALAWFSGDDDPAQRLDIVGRYFDEAASGEPANTAPQPAFDAPRSLRASYPGTHVAAGPRRDGFVSMAWALDPPATRTGRLAWALLDHLLVGQAGAIRRALIDGGFGEDLIQSGFAEETLQPMFRIGLSGVDPARFDEVCDVILATLHRVLADGFDVAALEGALNTLEFRLREGPQGHMPAGLVAMLEALKTWRHDGAPFSQLHYLGEMAELRQALAEGALLFEPMIERDLLENPHRAAVLLQADPDLAAARAGAEAARLAALRESMGDAGFARIADAHQALQAAQARPDTPAELASVPVLALADLPRRFEPDMVEVMREAQAAVLWHEPAVSGITHVDLGFDLGDLPAGWWPYARLLGVAMVQTGTRTQDHTAFARRVAAKTGGISPVLDARPIWAQGGRGAWLFLRTSALDGNIAHLVAIFEDALLHARLDDVARLRELVLQEMAQVEGALIPAGHDFVDRRLRAGYHRMGALDEGANGTAYLAFLRSLLADWAHMSEPLAARLATLRAWLVRPAHMVCSIAAAPRMRGIIAPNIRHLIAALDMPDVPLPDIAAPDVANPQALALDVPSAVNFVGVAHDLYPTGLPPTGASEAAARYLNATWLWDQVRVRGGAYGGQSRFDPASGVMTLLSYRDPHVLATLDVFAGAARFLQQDIGTRDVTRAIIGGIGALDQPLPPARKRFVALQRLLSGQSDHIRMMRRDALLSATAADFRALGQALGDSMAARRVVVLGGPAGIDAAMAARPGFFTRARVL